MYKRQGFTGRLCAEYFQSNYPDLNWAISGRNKEKLEDLKEELNLDCDVFVADSDDYDAIQNFVNKQKLYFLLLGLLQDTAQKL